jgi:hypothetical protein
VVVFIVGANVVGTEEVTFSSSIFVMKRRLFEYFLYYWTFIDREIAVRLQCIDCVVVKE